MIVAGLLLGLIAWLFINEWRREQKQRRLDEDFREFLSETYIQPSNRRKAE